MIAKGIVIAALACAPSAAFALDSNSGSTDEKEKKERVICRSERATGSRIAVHRVCKTKAEWIQNDREVDRVMSERSGQDQPAGALSGNEPK